MQPSEPPRCLCIECATASRGLLGEAPVTGARRSVMRRLVTKLIVLACAVFGGLTVAFGTAFAAPVATSITIEGPGLARPITIRSADQREFFAKLLNEVNWLATRPGNAPALEAAKLGVKYTLL